MNWNINGVVSSVIIRTKQWVSSTAAISPWSRASWKRRKANGGCSVGGAPDILLYPVHIYRVKDRWVKWNIYLRITYIIHMHFISEWWWKYRCQSNTLGKGFAWSSQHTQGIWNIHCRSNVNTQAEGWQKCRGMGSMFKHSGGPFTGPW